MRRLRVALLAPAGMLAGHSLGYLLVLSPGHEASHVPHAHLPALVALGAPAGVAALLAVVLRGMRGRARTDLGVFTAVQSVAYIGLEVLERVSVGLPAPAVLIEPPVLMGLVCQAVAAVVLVGLVGASRRAHQLIRGPVRRTVAAARERRSWPDNCGRVVAGLTCPSALTGRGPPHLLVTLP